MSLILLIFQDFMHVMIKEWVLLFWLTELTILKMLKRMQYHCFKEKLNILFLALYIILLLLHELACLFPDTNVTSAKPSLSERESTATSVRILICVMAVMKREVFLQSKYDTVMEHQIFCIIDVIHIRIQWAQMHSILNFSVSICMLYEQWCQTLICYLSQFYVYYFFIALNTCDINSFKIMDSFSAVLAHFGWQIISTFMRERCTLF